jgi:hypothetical protein
MVRRNRFDDDRAARVETAPRARGGVSLGAVLTGVVVAFGSAFLLSALIGGVLAATGAVDENITRNDVVQAGIGAGIAFAVAQFLAYLWGGYTAGRMARGAGALNGLLVPILAIVLALIVGGVAAALGATAELNLPFTNARLPLEESYEIEWGVALSVAALVTMFLGGILGGALGARWHTKLERRAAEEVEGRHISPRPAEAGSAGRPADEPARRPTSEEPAPAGGHRADEATTREPRR